MTRADVQWFTGEHTVQTLLQAPLRNASEIYIGAEFFDRSNFGVGGRL